MTTPARMTQTPLGPLLLDRLRRSGPITFAEYMELSLYHPEHGYYMQVRERTGVHGDYFTSADLHPIFARLIARQAAEMWEILGRPARLTWVEMGAGRGFFAQDFTTWIARARPDFAAALDYVAVEPGPRQRARLAERLAHEAHAGGQSSPPGVRVIADLEELGAVTGCFFSNELVDAPGWKACASCPLAVFALQVKQSGAPSFSGDPGAFGGNLLTRCMGKVAHYLPT